MPAVSLLYHSARQWLLEHSPKRIAIMHAQPRPELNALLDTASMHLMQQHFREWALALAQSGYKSEPQLSGMFDLILINPSKNRQQTLGWIANAVDHLHPSGHIMLCAENRHGAKGLEARLRDITDALASVSKSKCRGLRFPASAITRPELIAQWRQQSSMQKVESLGLYSMPGLFSWDHPDAGSQLLLEYLPRRLSGIGMDLCTGNGFLAAAIMHHSPDISHLHLIDHDKLALVCAEANVSTSKVPHSLHWLDAASEALPKHLDWIACNPPFHQQQEQSIGLGQSIVQRACQALKRGGRIWIVANRKLPYEKLLTGQLASVDILCQRQGYKIIYGVR